MYSKEKNNIAIELFKYEFGFNDVSIKQSAIPLRY